jgi:hypothetical protein
MNDKAEIKKIVLDLGNKEINLTIGQAKKLHKVLDDMFGKDDRTYPIIIERRRPYWSWGSESYSTINDIQMTYTSDNTLNLCMSN